jgi:hypothetical protein
MASHVLSDEVVAALRAAIIGRRQPISVIARVNGESERAVYQNIDRYDVSFIKVGALRYIDPVEYAEKRAQRIRKPTASLPPPRPVGRPRKLSK